MDLIQLKEQDRQSYNDFVVAQPSGSFLQAWEWGEWQKSLGNEPRRFVLTDDSGQWLTTLQCLTMPLPLGKYYVYVPYGPVLAEGESLKFQVESFKFLLQELQKKYPAAVFIRLEPQTELPELLHFGKKSINIQPAVTMVVDLASDEESLLSAMHPKTRYNIKVAQKSGIMVEHELAVTPGYGLYAQEAVNLILQTQSRQSYRGHSLGYYKKLIDFFTVQNPDGDISLKIYRALHNRKLLTSAIVMDFGKIRLYLYGGSGDEDRNLMAPYLLHWQAMLDAKQSGFEIYDLGGSEVSGGGERGFTRFKRGFGGREVNYPGAYDVYSNKFLYHGYRTLRQINRGLIYLSNKLK